MFDDPDGSGVPDVLGTTLRTGFGDVVRTSSVWAGASAGSTRVGRDFPPPPVILSASRGSLLNMSASASSVDTIEGAEDIGWRRRAAAATKLFALSDI